MSAKFIKFIITKWGEDLPRLLVSEQNDKHQESIIYRNKNMLAFHNHIWYIKRQRFNNHHSVRFLPRHKYINVSTPIQRRISFSANLVRMYTCTTHVYAPFVVLRFMSHSRSHVVEDVVVVVVCVSYSRSVSLREECVVFSFPVAHRISMQHEVGSDLIMFLWLVLRYKLTLFQKQRIPRLFLACEINPHVMQCCWS